MNLRTLQKSRSKGAATANILYCGCGGIDGFRVNLQFVDVDPLGGYTSYRRVYELGWATTIPLLRRHND